MSRDVSYRHTHTHTTHKHKTTHETTTMHRRKPFSRSSVFPLKDLLLPTFSTSFSTIDRSLRISWPIETSNPSLQHAADASRQSPSFDAAVVEPSRGSFWAFLKHSRPPRPPRWVGLFLFPRAVFSSPMISISLSRPPSSPSSSSALSSSRQMSSGGGGSSSASFEAAGGLGGVDDDATGIQF